MPGFPIIDCHLHLYDPRALPYGWMKDDPILDWLHGPAEFEAASNGVAVEAMVFVEVDVDAGFHMAEARWVAEAAKTDRRVKAIVASVPLEKGRAVEADVKALAAMPQVRAVRRLIQAHVDEPGWCLKPDFVDGVRMLADYRLSFEIGIYHPQILDAVELVKRCPGVTFMLVHIGKPGIKNGVREPWWSGIGELARLPNVVCKVSGVLTEADHRRWAYDQVAPYIARAIECFGYDRVAFGGDWPVLERAAPYRDWVGVVDRVTAGASAADLKKLYRDNAIRHYRL
ncbi:MAG: amidohydrolase family protein [Bauldia sp.]